MRSETASRMLSFSPMSPVALAALALVLASLVLLYWTQEVRWHARLSARGADLGAASTTASRLARFTDCVLASVSSGVLVVDTLGRIQLMNAEAESILGCAAGTLVGRSLFDVPSLAALPGLVTQARAATPAAGGGRQFEIGITNLEGQPLPLGVNVAALAAEDGAVQGYVLVCRNLTETKALIADLEHSRKLSVLGTVAGGVAHNFNNILTTVLGRVQLLIRFPMTMEKVQESLRVIEKSALDGAATVKRIQDYTKKEIAATCTDAVDVNEIVDDVVSFTRARWQEQAREKGLTYDVRVEPGRVTQVRGSSSELREVLINLMLNAIDAMPRGGSIMIRTELVGTGSSDRNVRIRFSDDGPGMQPDVRARIFDPFFTTKGRNGTGLGLFESANIVQRHRGRLLCESQPGMGTTFIIELPATSEMTASAPPAPAARRG